MKIVFSNCDKNKAKTNPLVVTTDCETIEKVYYDYEKYISN